MAEQARCTRSAGCAPSLPVAKIPKGDRYMKIKDFLLRHLPLVCFGVALLLFLVFGGLMVRQALGGGQPEPPSVPSSSDAAPSSTVGTEPTPDPWAKNEDGILNIYAPYYEQNQDMIGWLRIEGTDIDYPVVRTPGNNEKYLRLGFDGAYATGGTLFLDENCDPGIDKVTANQMIYGHDMNDGTMFGKLYLYADEEYGKEHSTIRFDTIYETGEYELMAAFYSQVYYTTDTCFKYYKFFDAANEEEFNDYVSNVKELAEYDTGVTAEYGDTLLTLSTCSKHVENGRFVVVAKKVK